MLLMGLKLHLPITLQFLDRFQLVLTYWNAIGARGTVHNMTLPCTALLTRTPAIPGEVVKAN